MYRKILMAMVGIYVAGCATQGEYFNLNPENDKEAIVDIFRDSVKPYAFNLEIFVDGKIANKVSDNLSTSFSIPIGKHQLLLKWEPIALSPGSVQKDLQFSAKEHRYFVVTEKAIAGPMIAFLFTGDRLRLFEVKKDYYKQIQKINLEMHPRTSTEDYEY